jgi:hypothetical protein
MNPPGKCDEMLFEMLSADADALRGEGLDAVAVHVRGCSRCRAVAARMVQETSSLAAAVASAPMGVRPRSRAHAFAPRVAVVLAAAATLMLIVYPEQQPLVESERPAAAVSVVAPAVVAAAPAPARAPGRTAAPRVESAMPVAATTISVAPLESPVPVAAVQIAVAPSDTRPVHETAAGLVTVAPPPGVHARVTQTRNPSITVVWLYR